MSLKRKTLKVLSLLLVIVLSISIMTPALAEESEPTWTTVEPMTLGRYDFSSAVINGKIYVMGGVDNNSPGVAKSVEMYDPLTNTWTAKADMPNSCSKSNAVVVDDKIYVFPSNKFNSGTNVYVYNPMANEWTTTNFNEERYKYEVAVLDGKIYIMGGTNSNNKYFDTVEMYDPATNTWVEKASLLNARYNITSVVLNGKIYAISGYGNGISQSLVEEYNPSTDTWAEKAPVNSSTTYSKAVVLNNKIYIVGGSNSSSVTNALSEYDPATNTWTAKTSMDISSYEHKIVVIDDNLFCLGGRHENTYFNSVKQYDPNTNAWTTKASMADNRCYSQAVVVDNTIYAIGGSRQSGSGIAFSSVEKYSLSPNSPTVPLNLTAIGGDSKIDLSWGAITEATSYNVYRSTTAGGPYTKIADGVNGTAYTDSDVTNGTTYYYVVTAVTTDGESEYSNEASATPNKSGTEPEPEAGNTILEIYMVDGTEKEYELTSDKINEFLEWFDTRSEGSGKAYYVFEKTYSMGPYTSRDDYIIFDKIRDFEVNQYN